MSFQGNAFQGNAFQGGPISPRTVARITRLSLDGYGVKRAGSFAGKGGGGPVSYTLTSDSASYVWTGTAAGLYHGYKVSAASGSYIWTGTAANLLVGYKLTSASASYVYTGTAAGLYHGYKVTAASAAYTYSATSANLLAARLLTSGSASYLWNASAVTLNKGVTLTATSASYAWTGTDVALVRTYVLSSGSASYLYAGSDVTLTYTTNAPPPVASSRHRGGSVQRLRLIDFEEMYRHIDAVNERTLQEKQASLERIRSSIEQAVNALSEAAEKTHSPQPRAVIKAAQVVNKQISKELVAALAGKPARQPFFSKPRDLQAEINGLIAQMQEAQERLLARARELEEDDEDVLLLMS